MTAPSQPPTPDDGYFHTRMAPHRARAGVWRVICDYLQRFMRPDGVVLDLGAGYCDFINQVAAAEKHAVDVAPGFTAHAAAGVQTHVQSAVDLQSLAAAHFDTVLASNLLEHLTHAELAQLAAGVRRILRPGGLFILIQPNYRYAYREYFDDYTHVTVFSEVSLTDFLVAQGFAVVHVEPRFLPLTLKQRGPKPQWLVRLYLALPYRPLAGQMLVIVRRPPAPAQAR